MVGSVCIGFSPLAFCSGRATAAAIAPVRREATRDVRRWYWPPASPPVLRRLAPADRSKYAPRVSLSVRLISVSLIAGSLALISGCGGSSDEEKVNAAVTGYLSGLADGDGKEACSHLTGDGKRELATFLVQTLGGFADLSVSCDEQVKELSGSIGEDERPLLRNAEINVTVSGDSATAQLVGGDGRDIELIKSGEEWLVDGGFVSP